ncbi:RmlC-like cupin domain-containing protein [Gigaspora rosea]|uniref:RmlC-like cupin domain-containing protein n=1 Tax=Gigaspora rosea TaxID=44941 RepID=A0A397W8C6_9GLOM|nr:RmlC-like cupin domain-containing protein [Gigaspora rosea]
MNAQFVERKSKDRGHVNHDWLDAHHTLSFASYFDHKFKSFGALKAMNENIVQPNAGFGTHPHREFEIFSYIISGELQHKDSIGNIEILKPGNIQFTSCGTGITHSEYNVHPTLPVHFLQVWVKPDKSNLKPRYQTMTFDKFSKTNKLVHIISPVDYHDNSTIGINTDFHAYASLLEPSYKVVHTVQGTEKPRKVYIHLMNTGGKLNINERVILQKGDGVFVTDVKRGDEIVFESIGDEVVEFVVLDLA